MDDLFEAVFDKDEVDEKAKECAYRYKDEEVFQALEHYELQEAEIQEMLNEDFHRQIHSQETIMEYAEALYNIVRIVHYLRERFFTGPDDSMEGIEEEFAAMTTR